MIEHWFGGFLMAIAFTSYLGAFSARILIHAKLRAEEAHTTVNRAALTAFIDCIIFGFGLALVLA